VQQRAAKRALLRQIGAGRHPLTREGVIIRRESALPIKMKPRAEYDVWVRSVFPGQGRLQGTAGGFRFAWTPRGPVAGRVGTGFSVAQRRELLRQAGRFRGRAARVTAQQRYPSGALRGAAFAGWHVEKNER
jgi:ATP-dependent DNA ligase